MPSRARLIHHKPLETPALLIRMSTGPTSAARRRASSALDRSAATKRALPPAFSISCTVLAPRSALPRVPPPWHRARPVAERSRGRYPRWPPSPTRSSLPVLLPSDRPPPRKKCRARVSTACVRVIPMRATYRGHQPWVSATAIVTPGEARPVDSTAACAVAIPGKSSIVDS